MTLTGWFGVVKEIIVHSRSVDPRKLCIGEKYYIVHTVCTVCHTTLMVVQLTF